jgi:hypothetical protein
MKLNNVVLFLAFLSAIGCDCDQGEEEFAGSDFSWGIGRYWKYDRFDNNSQQRDTIVATVVNTDTTIFGKSGLSELRWATTSGEYVESHFVLFDADTATYYYADTVAQSLVLNSKIVFPLHNGDQWFGDFDGDVYKVESDSFDVAAYGLSYGLSYLVDRSAYFGPGASTLENIYIVKNIGIVVRETSVFMSFPVRSELLKLIEHG